MKSHEIDFEIFGDDMQAVEIELDPSETVIAEAGAMNWMDPHISFEAKFGDGSTPNQSFFSKIASAGKRAFTGESLFITHFTNKGREKQKVAFAAPYPGRIIPIDLKANGNKFVCQKDAFLCAAFGTKLSVEFTKTFGAGFFGGEGFILQKLIGDGFAFIHAGGTIVKKSLNNQKILVDTGCLVGYSGNIRYNIQRAGNLKSMFFGGEGLFLATLEGQGEVYLQSLPFSRLANRVHQSMPKITGQRQVGESSFGGSLGGIIGNILGGGR
jgi:uncharacterized protein (TIGR00266 family)